MDEWLKQAAQLLKERAPLLTDKHADEIACDLYVAWSDDTPSVAIAKFFREVPVEWKAASTDTSRR